ncbi:MAG: hypothetical protein JW829_18195 [Pirellulales bacterium]|nr:hypothetical protein [Pirellulales bacterium]
MATARIQFETMDSAENQQFVARSELMDPVSLIVRQLNYPETMILQLYQQYAIGANTTDDASLGT